MHRHTQRTFTFIYSSICRLHKAKIEHLYLAMAVPRGDSCHPKKMPCHLSCLRQYNSVSCTLTQSLLCGKWQFSLSCVCIYVSSHFCLSFVLFWRLIEIQNGSRWIVAVLFRNSLIKLNLTKPKCSLVLPSVSGLQLPASLKLLILQTKISTFQI